MIDVSRIRRERIEINALLEHAENHAMRGSAQVIREQLVDIATRVDRMLSELPPEAL